MAQKLFTFAIVSDTHIRPRKLDESSPWRANSKANARANYLVERFRQLEPEFVLHLGDMVHPVPKLPSYNDAARLAVDIFSRIGRPVHFIPGNHDIGDKPLAGLPAEPVTDEALAAYGTYFGETYQAFTHCGHRFIMLNAEVLNTGLPAEAEQEAWLRGLLAEDTRTPTFVCMHYPLFLYSPDEVSCYDNIDEPARSTFLELFAQENVKAVFSGHVHHYFHHRHAGTDYVTLPAICFTRQDYSELFRAVGDNEWGRDDAPKLGFALVDVYEDDFVLRIERTYGRGLSEGEVLGTELPFQRSHPKDGFAARLGLHLRHDWTEVLHLPHNPMEEFVRREVRNDYSILALTEMGAGALRIPVSDLLRPEARERVSLLAEMGVDFTVFLFGALPDAVLAQIRSAESDIARIELICDWRNRENIAADLARLRTATDLPIILSRVHSGRDERVVGTKYHHFVSSGFGVEDWDRIDAWRDEVGNTADEVSGFAFRVPGANDPWKAVRSITRDAAKRGTSATAFIQLANDNPAIGQMDDLQNANRVAESFLAAAAAPELDLFIDTFTDLDRGYFPRSGLYDRLLNPRLAGKVYRTLNVLLNETDEPVVLGDACEETEAGKLRALSIGGRKAWLALPNSRARVEELEALLPGGGTLYDLQSGAVAAAVSDISIAPMLKME